jgi:TPR repeat protein
MTMIQGIQHPYILPNTRTIMRTKRFCNSVIAAVLLFASTIAFADELAEGIEAYENGDYALAREILMPLAEYHGYAKAMNALGLMSEQGLGQPADGTEAEKWYKKAALLADEDAMYNLGILYGEGTVFEKDNIKSLAWLGAAYDHRQDEALQIAKLVSTRMDEEQLAEAGKLRHEINALLYSVKPDVQGNLLSEPPVDRAKLLSSEQIIEIYSGHTVNFTFRDSPATEIYRKHSSKKKALAGKKSKLKGEYRDGFYKGKWWVENGMFCLDYSKIDVFDACFWIERLNENEMRTYSQKTGDIGTDRITN